MVVEYLFSCITLIFVLFLKLIVKKKPGLYYMIEHLPGTHTSLDKEKPWNLKQTRFVSRNINENGK